MDGNTRVLVVDDEFLIVEYLSSVVEDAGLQVCGTAATGAEALAAVQAHDPTVVLLDVRLSGGPDGIEVAREINAISGAAIIFITGSREPETTQRIATVKSRAVLYKPIRDSQLIQALRGLPRMP